MPYQLLYRHPLFDKRKRNYGSVISGIIDLLISQRQRCLSAVALKLLGGARNDVSEFPYLPHYLLGIPFQKLMKLKHLIYIYITF